MRPHEKQQDSATFDHELVAGLPVRHHVTHEEIAKLAGEIRELLDSEGADPDRCFLRTAAEPCDHPELWRPFLRLEMPGRGYAEMHMTDDNGDLQFPQEEQAVAFALWLAAQLNAALCRC